MLHNYFFADLPYYKHMASRTLLQASRSSPVVQEASLIVSNDIAKKSRFTWGILSLGISILCFFELQLSWVKEWTGLDEYPYIQHVIFGFGILFLWNAVVCFTKVVRRSFKQPHMMMSPVQRRLMGLKADDKTYQQLAASSQKSGNFGFSELKKPDQATSTPNRAELSPSHKFVSTPSPNSSLMSTSASPINPSKFNSSYRSPRSMLMRTPPGVGTSFDGSFLNSSGGSPILRHRRSYNNSPLSPDDYMTDQNKLTTYLDNYEKESVKANNHEKSYSMGWNMSFKAHDYSSELAENIYQLSCKSPKSPMRTKESKDDSARQAVEDYWNMHDVTYQGLNDSVATLRQYLSVTVLRRFVSEIDLINKKLEEIGCADTKVGKSSLSSLKLVQIKHLQHVPSLTWILFYLELSNNQEYLVQRIRTLTSGYMSEFKWNKETKPKLRETEEELPNDCDMVMHALCVYIDLHFPLNPRYPDGKSFSACYYRDASKEKSKDFDSKLYIERSKLNPPHYQVVYQGKLYDPQGGRHNLFHSIILFLHFVKTDHNSMLGPVSLGRTGLNILHVLDM